MGQSKTKHLRFSVMTWKHFMQMTSNNSSFTSTGKLRPNSIQIWQCGWSLVKTLTWSRMKNAANVAKNYLQYVGDDTEGPHITGSIILLRTQHLRCYRNTQKMHFTNTLTATPTWQRTCPVLG